MIKRALKSMWRWLRRLVGMLVLAVLALVVYASTAGIPETVSAWVLSRVDPRQFTLETGHVRWHPLHGLVIQDFALYRKRVIGPAAVEAPRARLRLNPISFFREGPVWASIKVYDGLVRPAMLLGGERDDDVSEFEAESGSGMRKGVAVAIHIERCEVLGVRIRDLRSHLDVAEGQIRLTGVEATLEDDERIGYVKDGFFSYDRNARDLDISVETRLDPRLLLPVMAMAQWDALAALAGEFEFEGEPPRCEIKVQTRLASNETAHVQAEFWVKDGRFRTVPFTRADGTVRVQAGEAGQTVEVGPLFVVRPEGIATGHFTVDAGRAVVAFDAASTLNPKALALMIGLDGDALLDRVDFRGYANIAARGDIFYKDRDQSSVAMTVVGRDALFDFLPFTDYEFTMRMAGRSNVVVNVRAHLLGGSLSGSFGFMIPAEAEDTPVRYATSLQVEGLDFEQLVAAANPDKVQNYEGRFSLHLDLKGVAGPDALKHAQGQGRMRIKEGRVLMLPIFGGLTGMLSQYIPGIDFLARQDYARSEFTVSDGHVFTDKATIEGNIIRIQGRGDYGIENGSLDFRVQIRFLRERNVLSFLVDIPTWVLSKFFEFQLKGTVKDPAWTPFGPTMDLLRRIGLRE